MASCSDENYVEELAEKGKFEELLPLEIHCLFQHLWTKAVGTDTYNKTEWRALQQQLERKGIFG